jgi:tetratricopeptide (TPR) repeat protein
MNGWAEDGERSLASGLAAAEQAVAMDEEEPLGHFALAVARLFSRQHDQALFEAERCLALAPSFAEGRMALAHILIFNGDAGRAIDVVEATMRLDPFYPDIALYFLAEARFALGQYDEAVAALKQRLARNPQSETSYALLASCHGHLGQVTEGRAAWAELKRLAPDFSIERPPPGAAVPQSRPVRGACRRPAQGRHRGLAAVRASSRGDYVTLRRAGSSGGSRPGAKAPRSTWRAAPSSSSSLIASPVAGAFNMPHTLWPVAT